MEHFPQQCQQLKAVGLSANRCAFPKPVHADPALIKIALVRKLPIQNLYFEKKICKTP